MRSMVSEKIGDKKVHTFREAIVGVRMDRPIIVVVSRIDKKSSKGISWGKILRKSYGSFMSKSIRGRCES